MEPPQSPGGITHAALIQRAQTATYDPRDRLASLTKTDPTSGATVDSEAYLHDANDNVISQTVKGTPSSFTYDRNRLVSAVIGGAAASYNYDPFGRLDTVTAASGQILQRYTYDGFDRIAQQTKSNGTSTTISRYTYDPLDRTSSQTDNAGATGEKTTTFDYLGLSGNVVNESVSGQLQRSYQYSPWGERLSQTKRNTDGTSEESFYSYNPHSDVETLTDQNGDPRATYGYTAFGQNDDTAFTGVDKPNPSDPTKQPYNFYRFNAKRFDPTSGTYDMGFRDYDPGLNRFLTRDMYNGALADLDLATDPFTSNRYTFGGGNPISNIELDGHRPAGCEGSCLRDFGIAQSQHASETTPINDDVEGTLAGWAGGGGRMDPSKLGQLLAACGTGELGEAATEAGKTATGSARQDSALHLQCNTLQEALRRVQLAGGPTVLLPGATPGVLASTPGGGQGNPGTSRRVHGIAVRLRQLAGTRGVTVSVTRAIRRVANGQVEYVDLVSTTQGKLNERQRNFLSTMQEKGGYRFLEVETGFGQHAEEVQLDTIRQYEKFGWRPAALGSSTNICITRCWRSAQSWPGAELTGKVYGASSGRQPYQEIIWPFMG